MREIKFRGKRLDNGEWVIGDLFQPRGGIKDIIAEGASGHIEKHPIAPATVGQFTGLLDKNGREIYEGDVLSVAGIPVAIYWDEQYLEYYMMSGSGDSDRLTLEDAKYEIIGNIHDNPNLLSTDKNS